MNYDDIIYMLFNMSISIIGIAYIAMLIYNYYRKEKRRSEELIRKRYTYELCMGDSHGYINMFQYNEFQKNKIYIEGSDDNILETFEYCNKIAAGVNNGILDENVINSFYGGYFTQVYYGYRLYLLTYREKNSNPFMFIEFDKLMEKWNSKNIDNNRINTEMFDRIRNDNFDERFNLKSNKAMNNKAKKDLDLKRGSKL